MKKILQSAKRLLKDTKGEGSDFKILIYFPWVFLIIFCAISVGGELNKISLLTDFANGMAEVASREGKCIGSEIDERYEILCEVTGLSPEITFSADYIDIGRKKVQYGDSITVTATAQSKFYTFGNLNTLQTYTKKATRQSFQYWKNY